MIRTGFRQLFILMTLAVMTQTAVAVELHHVIRCSVFDHKGTLLQNFPGTFCVFLDDGSYVSANDATGDLIRFSPDSRKIWRQPVRVHHQLNLNPAKNELLVLASSVHKYAGKLVRFDRLEVRGLDGGLKKAFDFFPHRKELLKLAGKTDGFMNSYDVHPPDQPPWEFSHLNSFYEIPENHSTLPEFKSGNYVINVNALGLVLILDPQLKNILWSLKQKPNHTGESNYHDVQVLPSGRLLIYNNYAFHPTEKTGFHSAIEEYDPHTKSYTTVYSAKNPDSFASPNFGGVQRLENGNLLISDISKGGLGFEADARGRRLWKISLPQSIQKPGFQRLSNR